MSLRTLSLCLTIIAVWKFVGQEVGWWVFAIAVLVGLDNLKKAMFEIPGVLKAILSAMGATPEEEEAEVIEPTHTVRIKVDGVLMVVRCSSAGWVVHTSVAGLAQKRASCPREPGAAIEIEKGYCS